MLLSSTRYAFPMSRTHRFADWLMDSLWRFAERLTGHSVHLNQHAAINWPECCIGCGRRGPEVDLTKMWTIRFSRFGLFSYVLGAEPWWRTKQWLTPVCADCHRSGRHRVWLGRLLPPAVLIAMILAGVPLGRWIAMMNPTLGKVVFLSIVVGAIVTAIAINLKIGSLVAVSRQKDQFIFEFTTRAAADAFAAANDTKRRTVADVWQEMDGDGEARE